MSIHQQLDPYHYKLKALKGHEVIIDRRGAPQVKGEMLSVDTIGCIITTKHQRDPDLLLETFIAFRDICGVSNTTYDYDLFGH